MPTNVCIQLINLNPQNSNPLKRLTMHEHGKKDFFEDQISKRLIDAILKIFLYIFKERQTENAHKKIYFIIYLYTHEKEHA